MGRSGQRGSSAIDPIWSELALQVVLNAYPAGAIRDVVGHVGCGEQRDRLLNSTLLVRFVLALPLFPALGYRDVLRQVLRAQSGDNALPAQVASSPALSKGRRRLGVAVFEELFRRSAPDRCLTGSVRDRAGREVLLASEATIGSKVPFRTDPELRPLVTLHTLRTAGSGHLLAAGLSDATRPAGAVWFDLLESIPGPLLLVADLHDASALLHGLIDRDDVELLWQPAGIVHFLAEDRLADGSIAGKAAHRGVHGHGSERSARVLDKLGGNPLPIGDRPGDRLMTTILDSDHAPAGGLVSLHRASTAASETTARHLEALNARAKDREGIEQEVWAFLLVQRAMHRVAMAP